MNRAERLSEASEWLLRLQAAERTEADRVEWLRWCDADPENFAAFETVQRRWRDLDLLSGYRFAPSRRLPVWKWALAAAVTAIAVALGVAGYRYKVAVPTEQLSAADIKRSSTLPDGSRLILGTQSRVEVDFNGSARRLDLSSGEAYFKVRHDRARPFVVKAGEVSVTAIGTAFDVRRGRDAVIVTVEEGTVELGSRDEGGRPAVWRAQAGYQIEYSLRRRTASIASVDPAAELAWRAGELAYLYEPLGSVVEDLNRYSGKRLVVADERVAKIPFTGTAFAASLDGWLVGIEQAYPVTVRREGGEIVLSSRE